MVEAETLRAVLNYSRETGEFTHVHNEQRPARWNSRWAGKRAGGPHSSGYWSIGFNGKKHLAHRLAWLHVYGTWPSCFVDHINLNKRDNRIVNLREADFAESSANISTRKNTASGYRGVSFLQKRQKWTAKITKDKRSYFLGYFGDKENAAKAYALAAERMYGEFCPQHLSGAV